MQTDHLLNAAGGDLFPNLCCGNALQKLELRLVDVVFLLGAPQDDGSYPHIFATDIGDCFFQILEIVPVVEEENQAGDKRRRQIIILRKASMIALRPDLPLAKSRLIVGGGLKILMHWDSEIDNSIQYLELDKEGVSDTKTLVLDEGLTHEQATELIRELAR